MKWAKWVILVLALAGCNSGSDSGSPIPSIDPPTNLQAVVADGEITLSWSPAPEADAYHLYYAHESGIDPENYAIHEGGTWLKNVSSPLTLNLENKDPVYRFAVTAVSEGIESPPSNEAMAVIRYVLGEDGSTVIDLTTGLEWMRCSWGQAWSSEASMCTGEHATGNYSQISQATPSGWRSPTRDEFLGIVFCDSGIETARFPVHEPPMPEGSCHPYDSVHSVAVHVESFPESSFPSARSYITSSIRFDSFLQTNIVSVGGFSFGGAGFSTGLQLNHPDIILAARFVRPASSP